jgi:hypothetical protein
VPDGLRAGNDDPALKHLLPHAVLTLFVFSDARLSHWQRQEISRRTKLSESAKPGGRCGVEHGSFKNGSQKDQSQEGCFDENPKRQFESGPALTKVISLQSL